MIKSAADIARTFYTSDSHVLDVFDRFVDMRRLSLSDVISVDEVYLNMDQDCRYMLVIQDFLTSMNLWDDFICFRLYAHPEQDEDEPFPRYVL